METPCPRCGTIKTESVRHGFIHDTLWNMGYHLRRCSYCNRWRLFKRGDRHRPHPDDLTIEELQERFKRKIAAASGKLPADSERLGGNMASDPLEQSRGPGAQPSTSSVSVAEVTDEYEDYRVCPKCGSKVYRRSRRRWYERLIKRPRMARCMQCDRRFPYPH
jgi:DNA-directed RNA polymerase subunit RPC12/RpoP